MHIKVGDLTSSYALIPNHTHARARTHEEGTKKFHEKRQSEWSLGPQYECIKVPNEGRRRQK